MSDNITFNLAKAGCSVSKYLPFWSYRRCDSVFNAQGAENSSVAGQTGRELRLIKNKEKKIPFVRKYC